MQNHLQRKINPEGISVRIVFTDGFDTRVFAWAEGRLRFLRNIFPASLVREEINQIRIGKTYTNIGGGRSQITISPQALIRKIEKMALGICDWLNKETLKEESFTQLVLVAPASIMSFMYLQLTPEVQKKVIVQIDQDAKRHNHLTLEKEIGQILINFAS